LAGHGIALCPSSLLKDDLEAGRLIALSEVAVHSNKTYYILEPPDVRLKRDHVNRFRDWLVETALTQSASFGAEHS
jgi:LysR family glycine cleavage system transcriptional activator